MPLTLGNTLTKQVSREVNSAQARSSSLGESMVTGQNQNVAVVDGFLGHSLKDGEIFLGALAKSTSYAMNMMTITEQYLETITSFLQKGIITIATAGTLSDDKVNVLQKYISDIRSQIDLLVDTASFDGRKLLSGGATRLDVQLGKAASDGLTVEVSNIGGNNLYRTSLALAINDWLAGDPTGARTPHYSAAELAKAVLDNENIIQHSAAGGGGGSGAVMTANDVGATLFAVRGVNPKMFESLHEVLPVFSGRLTVLGTDFVNATAAHFANVMNVVQPNGIQAMQELFGYFTNRDTTPLKTQLERTISLDVLRSALVNLRGEQAKLRTQKQNLSSAVDALRATTNTIQKTADSYLKTDYVLTAQEYSQMIRIMTASITALQAANKIPEAAQRLIDSLTR